MQIDSTTKRTPRGGFCIDLIALEKTMITFKALLLIFNYFEIPEISWGFNVFNAVVASFKLGRTRSSWSSHSSLIAWASIAVLFALSLSASSVCLKISTSAASLSMALYLKKRLNN